MKISGIVLFNPDIVRLEENITAIENQVDKLVLVDNGSNNIEEIRKKAASHTKVTLVENGENLGIAVALNKIVLFAYEHGAEWVLTLDQDSVVYFELVLTYEKYVSEKNIGILTCIIKDRNSSLLVSFDKSYKEVENCITSGSYTNVKACMELGGFDEKMFIDYVDFDMCQTMRKNGYKVLRINYVGVLHEVGKTRVVKFLGKEKNVYNHSPFRKYYIVRNHLYYIKKHKHHLDVVKEYFRLIKYILLVVIYEEQRIEKIKNIFKGISDSRKMQFSRKV